MKASEIREKKLEDIEVELDDAREELMRLRFQQASGELTDFNRLSATRRNIARLQTVLNELKRNAPMEGEE